MMWFVLLSHVVFMKLVCSVGAKNIPDSCFFSVGYVHLQYDKNNDYLFEDLGRFYI